MPSASPERHGWDHAGLIADIIHVVSMNDRHTKGEPVNTAAAVLRIDLDRSGIKADQDWCRNAVRTVRAGEPLIVELDGEDQSSQ